MNQQEALIKLQNTELEILLVIDEFCRKNKISWFLDGGTALGAIRHQGFIPWDDDVDVGMLRDDYDRFMRLAENGLPKGYSLHHMKNTPGYAAFFAKVYKDGTRFENQETREAGCPQGIYVDVFPYDRLPKKSLSRRMELVRASLGQKLSYLYHARTICVPHKGPLGFIEKTACSAAHAVLRVVLTSAEPLARFFNGSIVRDERELSDECLSLVWPNMEPLDRGMLAKVEYAQFEGYSLPVPRSTEHYLENMYGDWRTLPAPEDRHTHLPLLIDFGDGTSWEAEA